MPTVYPKKYAHGFVVLCFVVVMQSFIMNSHEVFIHILQGCFAGTGAIVRLPQCQWSKPDGYGKINQCITTTKHSKAKTVCIFLGIYCMSRFVFQSVQLPHPHGERQTTWRTELLILFWAYNGIIPMNISDTSVYFLQLGNIRKQFLQLFLVLRVRFLIVLN